MARITATLSRRIDARVKAEILLRFVGGRDHIYRLHSRLSVAPGRWKDGAVVIPRLETQEQRELRALRGKLDGLTAYLLDEFEGAAGGDVTKEWMQGRVDAWHRPERERGRDFYELFEEFRRSRDISKERDNRYGVTIRAVRRFQEWSGREITVEGLDAETLDALRTFLEEEYIIAGQRRWRTLYQEEGRRPERRSRNVVVDYMKVLRTFYNWLNRTGETEARPFRTFDIGTAVYGTPYYISIEERERIYRTELGPALAAQRDVFVFQCLTGCRVGDLVGLRQEDVVDGVLVYVPRKTIKEKGRTVRVPLTATAREIVERYAGECGGRLLPFISPQKYNQAIKRIFTAAGITRPVSVLDPVTRTEVKLPLNRIASSHLARRTFVGNLYKRVKDQNIIGSMSGHEEGSAAFARYRDIDDELKAGIVEMLESGQEG